MAWWNRSGNDYDSNRTWDDTAAAALLNEADLAQAGWEFESPVHIDAFPDEGAIYVSDGPSDDYDTAWFHYSDPHQADRDLLTELNSNWNG